MTDTTASLAFEPSFASGEWRRKLTTALTARKPHRAASPMLELSWSNLDVRLRMIDEAALQSESQKRTYQAVEGLVAEGSAKAGAEALDWDDVYKAERMIALLLGGPLLRQEISVRLQELTEHRVPCADAVRREYELLLKPASDAPAADDAMLRAFLLRVLETIQWSAKKKYLAQPIHKIATKRVLFCALVAFLFIVAPYLIVGTTGPEGISKAWSLFALHSAVASGLLGACFSRLISVQRGWSEMSLDEVFLHREWSYTFLRAGVGVCGALIVYFFLRSEFMSGAIFPDFANVSMRYVQIDAEKSVGMTFVMPSKDLALLTFWCFIAGFSEALVPRLLANSEQQFLQATAARRDK